jgi:hypothetical protein
MTENETNSRQGTPSKTSQHQDSKPHLQNGSMPISPSSGQLFPENPIINVRTIKEYIDTAFEESRVIKQRQNTIKRLKYEQFKLMQQEEQVKHTLKKTQTQVNREEKEAKTEEMVIHVLKDRLKFLGKKKKTVKVKLPYKRHELYSDLT